MVGAIAEIPFVAKKRGRPKSENPRGEGKSVRLDPDIVGKAKVVTSRNNLELGPYLSKLLEGPVNRDYQRVLKELAEEGGK